MRMDREQYRRYLKSPYWQRVRKKLYKKRGRRSELSGKTGRLEIHHKNYSHLGFEMDHLEDLMIVTRYEHKRIHGKLWWQKLLRW